MSYPQINLDVTYSSTDAGEFPDVGSCFWEHGLKYCVVYNAGATAIAAGDVVGVFSTTPAAGHVSRNAATVIESTLGTAMPVAGVAVGAIAASAYGVLQVRGRCANITTDGGVAAGDPLVCDGGAAPSFVADTAIAGEEHLVFGFADAADASTVGVGYLTNCVLDN